MYKVMHVSTSLRYRKVLIQQGYYFGTTMLVDYTSNHLPLGLSAEIIVSCNGGIRQKSFINTLNTLVNVYVDLVVYTRIAGTL